MFSKKLDQSRIPDPGFGEKIGGRSKRLINHDGSFNVSRKGGERGLRVIYQYLVEMNNITFFLMILISYITISLFFALFFFWIGTEHLIGVRGETLVSSFMDCFYFSTQTFTTVGYGAIAPRGILASTVASFEAFTGLIFFAIATGLMYARFSKPRALLRYSSHALVSPFGQDKAIMFRLANARKNVLMDVHARMIMVMRQSKEDQVNRKYYSLKLELDQITFLPLSWTLVHKLDETSPLYGVTADEMKDLDLEIMVLITAFDDTFHQTVHSRHSYTGHEVVWNARFLRAFKPDETGEIILDLNDLDKYEHIESNNE
ncbi:MAG: Inward rectifier potassium channel Irk [Flavobacteriales bacterium]|nr:Inward rectifier potassium channel Irk [Flavobacteriales bacterium]